MIIALITVGFIMTSMADGDEKWSLYGIHKSVGLIVLGLIPLRLLWYIKNTLPELPSDLPRWQLAASKGMYHALYLMMVVLPVTGLSMSLYGGYPVGFFQFFTIAAFEKAPGIAGTMKWVHETGGYVLAAFVSVHILAALYHHFVRRDNILKRMLGLS